MSLRQCNADSRYRMFKSEKNKGYIMKIKGNGLSVVIKALVLTIALVPMVALAGTTERINVANDGSEANNTINYDNHNLKISANGRYIAFNSHATSLAPGVYNGQSNVFVRDAVLNTTVRVIESGNDGQQLHRNASTYYQPTGVDEAGISGNGRYVLLNTDASNLIAGGGYGYRVTGYVHDLRTRTTEFICYDEQGNVHGWDTYCWGTAISHDGRYVVFQTFNSSYSTVYVRDRVLGKTERIDLTINGTPPANGTANSTGYAISADGRYVAFASTGSNLAANDTNNVADIFVRDRVLGVTKLVNRTSQYAWPFNYSVSMSADGRYVAYALWNAYVYDTETNTTEQVNLRPDGTPLGYPSDVSISAALSGDGRYVVFSETSANVVAGDTNNKSDVFVRDRVKGITERVSVSTSGEQGNGDSLFPAISADGSRIVFFSDSNNLVAYDLNNVSDGFMRSVCR